MKTRRTWALVLSAVMVLAAGGLLAQPLLAAWPFNAEGSFERTLSVTGEVDLNVTTGSGSITVRPGESGRVYVKAQIRARGGDAEEKVRRLEASPPIEQNGNVIRIGRIEDRELRRNVSISYELVVPAATRLDADTGSGSQSIEGIRGPVKADTGSGSIRLSNIAGDVEADTGSGDISLTSIQGRVAADTGSGSIRARGVSGGFVGDTGSGDVILEQTGPGDVRVDTGSGSIEVRGVVGTLFASTGSGGISAEGKPTGNWKLSTGSGGIRVRLPAEVGFEFHAHTGSGGIYTDHPVTVQGAIKRNDLRGTVRGGGFRLELETGSGSIRIE